MAAHLEGKGTDVEGFFAICARVVELGLGLADNACHVINSYFFALVP